MVTKDLSLLKQVLVDMKKIGVWPEQLDVSLVKISKCCCNITQPVQPIQDWISELLECDTKDLLILE